MENENIEKKLYAYSLYSKDTETYSILVMGYDDKETIKYYNNSFNDIFKALSNYYKGDKLEVECNNFKDKVNNSCIYCVGYFDIYKGEFINDKRLLVDLFDFKFSLENKEDN